MQINSPVRRQNAIAYSCSLVVIHAVIWSTPLGMSAFGETIAVERGELSVLFRDNSQSPRILSGIQSLINVKHADGYDAFDPDGSSTSAGLNFEHITSGHKDQHNMFSPRHGVFAIHRIDDHTVELRRRREASQWDV